MAPNVLLVVLDAVRRDAIEPYGAASGSTPTIAGLARSGTAVEHAYAPASWTLPSHASMFTGLLSRRLGLGQPPEGSPQSARPAVERVSHRLLASVLRNAGYDTHGFSANLWVSEYSGFDIGFDSFAYFGEQRQIARGRIFRGRPDARLAWAWDGLRARADDGADSIRRALTGRIDQSTRKPSFWFVNLCECHSPYLPPRPWNDLPPAERVRASLEAQRHLNFQSICLYAAGRWEIPAEAFDRMRYLYRRAAGYMDRWLADVLAALQRRGILDDTLVIVTSDHGENFGEGGLIAHGFSVDQRLIHVPLVMSGPGTPEVDGPLSLAELPRLIADAAGADGHPYLHDDLPAAVAVAQYDRIGSPTDPRIIEFARRWNLDNAGVARLTATYSCATDGRHKLVRADESEAVFDLEADPDESAPLEPEASSGNVANLRAALAHPAAQQADAVLDASGAPTPSPDEIAAIERQMKLLGYM